MSSNHDDWVGAVAVYVELVLTGCYDNTVNIWSIYGEKVLVIPSHRGPVKVVTWLDSENFINASHDQTDNMNSWKSQSNSVEQVTSCSEEV